MSLKLQVLQTGDKQWAARVTLTSPKMSDWVYARTRKRALQKLHTKLGKQSNQLLSQVFRVHACADMVGQELGRKS